MGGGFPNSRALEQLSSTTLSSPEMLKSRVGNARTYICPLQQDLDLSPVLELPSGPSEKCLNCGRFFSIGDKFANHVKSCRANEEVLDLTAGTPDSFSDTDDLPDVPSGLYQLEGDDIETEMFEAARKESMETLSKPKRDEDCSTLGGAVAKMKNDVVPDSLLYIEVRREFVLSDALREARKKFNPIKFIRVSFVGEGAVDEGGPKREFFRLFAHDVAQNYFRGSSDKIRFFVNNITAVHI